MKKRSIKEEIKIATTYKVLISLCITCLSFATFVFFFPTKHIIDFVIPFSNVFLMLGLLWFFSRSPYSRARITIKICAAIGILTFIPPVLFFTIGAWQDQWRLVDELPPIIGIVIASLVIGMIMLPMKYKKYILVLWGILALPILHYLFNHLDELHTPRGREILSMLIPASLLFYIIYPYQNKITRHINQVTFDLQRSEESAFRDYLTDVFNRRGLSHWLGQRHFDDKIGVLLIDIDHFKNVNDHYGHSIGDRVLIELASRLRTVYTEEHAIARWGGEEFVIVLANPHQDTLNDIAVLFQTSLSSLPYKVVGKVTVSLGVSTINHHESFSTLIEQADKALYIAKNNGRNQTVFFPNT
ncbi:MAG: GGDEF domain-containing protein [Marinomonas foliarum]|uniref:GGDEF domain-containing protein n=1 Tax=Marinomonas foliarum TaxID=491950 RepID=UPI003F9931DF